MYMYMQDRCTSLIYILANLVNKNQAYIETQERQCGQVCSENNLVIDA